MVEYKKDKYIRLTFRVDSDLKKRLDSFSELSGVSLSDVLRLSLKFFLDSYESFSKFFCLTKKD